MKKYPRRIPYLAFLALLDIVFCTVIGVNYFHDRIRPPTEPIIMPLAEAADAIENTTLIANSKLLSIYDKPLTVLVGVNGVDRPLTFSSSDLKQYTTARVITDSADIRVGINQDAFFPDLIKALSVFDSSFNHAIAADSVGAAIRQTLYARFHDRSTEPVNVRIDSGPNTDGDLANKYIEVDISQQKMFTFQNGKLVKTYRTSTGKDYPTPTGTFSILNKSALGFSSIYNVWMPYWMGFSYSNELHAYFGIHELPYYYSAGSKIQRPRDFIGSPHTGGCVALDIGDAKEVYNFASVGTKVVIYQ